MTAIGRAISNWLKKRRRRTAAGRELDDLYEAIAQRESEGYEFDVKPTGSVRVHPPKSPQS